MKKYYKNTALLFKKQDEHKFYKPAKNSNATYVNKQLDPASYT